MNKLLILSLGINIHNILNEMNSEDSNIFVANIQLYCSKVLTNPRAQHFHLCSIVFLYLWSFHILPPYLHLGTLGALNLIMCSRKNYKIPGFLLYFPITWSLPCSLLLCTIVPPLPTLHLNHIPLSNFMLLFLPHFPSLWQEDQKKKKSIL